uniref:Uncharacterized protein n=1 Tax=Solanum lycopersicum TaxID=4081 RepID=A0A3Q7FCQ3_SOLLC
MARRFSRLCTVACMCRSITGVKLQPPILPSTFQSHPHTVPRGYLYPVLQLKVLRSYARNRRSNYDLFGGGIPKPDEFKKAWAKQMDDEENRLWTASEDESDSDKGDSHSRLRKEIRKAKQRAKAQDALKSEQEPEELSPGKQARKIAVENALKKLKKGPDGRYINVWEVMSDLDILIGAFENIISGPEYAELRQGGPKKLNMQFFKDIQARMRDPNFEFSPEIKLKPKSKLIGGLGGWGVEGCKKSVI